jgi:uncharacterized repeat protein (TIGR03803 family)
MKKSVAARGRLLPRVTIVAGMLLTVASPPCFAGTLTILYSFTDGADGELPYSTPLLTRHGALYGTSLFGGGVGDDGGTVFELTPTGKEKSLYQFSGQADGDGPNSTLIRDAAGNLYGTTQGGGNAYGGTIFEIAPDGTETVLYTFQGTSDGQYPMGGVLMDASGDLYGTTNWGGTYSWGTIFKLTPGGSFSVLYNFTGGKDGGGPFGPLVMDQNGNLFGVTDYGGDWGTCGGGGCGVAFRLGTDGTETVLHKFGKRTWDYEPSSGLIFDSQGNMYGTTSDQFGGGLYRLAPDGTEKILHKFSGPDGVEPAGQLAMDSKGNIFGATIYGGANNLGTIFRVTSGGRETVLYSFTGQNGDGADPYGGVVLGRHDELYGTTYGGGANHWGTLFRFDR